MGNSKASLLKAVYDCMLKFLSGILIIQVATVAMTLAVIKTDDRELWLAVLLLAVIIGLVTAFWFSSIAGHAKKDALANARDAFSKEREKLRVNAERQKTSLMRKSHEEIRKQTNRAHARSKLQTGCGVYWYCCRRLTADIQPADYPGFAHTGCRWWCAGRLSAARSAGSRIATQTAC